MVIGILYVYSLITGTAVPSRTDSTSYVWLAMAHVETPGLVLNLFVLGVPHIGWVVSSIYILRSYYIMLYSHEKSPWYLHILILYGTDMAHLKNRLLKNKSPQLQQLRKTQSPGGVPGSIHDMVLGPRLGLAWGPGVWVSCPARCEGQPGYWGLHHEL